jgi:hypothetical protein
LYVIHFGDSFVFLTIVVLDDNAFGVGGIKLLCPYNVIAYELI